MQQEVELIERQPPELILGKPEIVAPNRPQALERYGFACG